MYRLKNYFVVALMIIAATFVTACATKKLAKTNAPSTDTVVKAAPTPEKKPVAQPEKATMPAIVTKPVSYSFNNIQFDFDSYIIKTDNYARLDVMAAAMKQNQSTKFVLNGYSSAEGTAEHNLTLSKQRADAIKIYLVNAGVADARLLTIGNGENNPVASNTTEDGRSLNRRVEVTQVK